MKKFLIGIIAVIIAVGAWAYKPEVKRINGKLINTFYYNAALGSDQTDPNNYQLTSVTCNSGTAFVCSIQATDNGSGKPVFSGGTDPVHNPATYSTTYRR